MKSEPIVSVGTSVAVGIGLVLVCMYVAPHLAASAFLSFMALQLALGAAFAGLLLAVARQMRSAAIAACFAGVLAAPVLQASPSTQALPAGDGSLTVLWLNAQHRPVSVERLLRYNEHLDADIIAFAEMPVNWENRFRQALAAFGCREWRGEEDGERIVILSRSECVGQGAHSVPGGRDAIRWIAPSETGVDVVAVHAPRPFHPGRLAQLQAPWQAPALARRDRVIDAAAQRAATADAGILIGDFNAVPWGRAVRAIKMAGLKRVACGAPWHTTWRASHALPGFAIDHAFVPETATAQCMIGPDMGSDHRPIVLRVSF
ncbi:MAG: endonuclease/exonuclease/phosphatase family protein [Pseudomonadota bacterium]